MDSGTSWREKKPAKRKSLAIKRGKHIYTVYSRREKLAANTVQGISQQTASFYAHSVFKVTSLNFGFSLFTTLFYSGASYFFKKDNMYTKKYPFSRGL
jgi:hypothetical protein